MCGKRRRGCVGVTVISAAFEFCRAECRAHLLYSRVLKGLLYSTLAVLTGTQGVPQAFSKGTQHWLRRRSTLSSTCAADGPMSESKVTKPAPLTIHCLHLLALGCRHARVHRHVRHRHVPVATA